MDSLGKHGDFTPKTTINGEAIQPHYHKLGVGNGYYVIVPTKQPDNLDQLLADVESFLKTSTRKTKTVKDSSDES